MEVELAMRGTVRNELQARTAILDTERVERVLRDMGELKKRLREFISYEISVCQAICDAGMQHAMKGVKMAFLINTFSKMSSVELSRAVEHCMRNGITLRYYFETLRRDEKVHQGLKRVAEMYGRKVNEFDKTGIVRLEEYDSEGFSKLEKDMANAYKNRVKDVLLNHGGVCIGDGTYVDPSTHGRDVWQALVIRLKSVRNDIESAARLYRMLPNDVGDDQREYLDSISFVGFVEFAEVV